MRIIQVVSGTDDVQRLCESRAKRSVFFCKYFVLFCFVSLVVINCRTFHRCDPIWLDYWTLSLFRLDFLECWPSTAAAAATAMAVVLPLIWAKWLCIQMFTNQPNWKNHCSFRGNHNKSNNVLFIVLPNKPPATLIVRIYRTIHNNWTLTNKQKRKHCVLLYLYGVIIMQNGRLKQLTGAPFINEIIWSQLLFNRMPSR